MPKIAYASSRRSSGKEELFGHCCHTREAMQEYCDAFPGSSFEIVEDDFDFGEYIPEAPKPNPLLDENGKPRILTAERRAAIESVLAVLQGQSPEEATAEYRRKTQCS